jgi:hypothetical protein
MKSVISVMIVTLTAGCVATTLDVPRDHPANPDYPAAKAPPADVFSKDDPPLPAATHVHEHHHPGHEDQR